MNILSQYIPDRNILRLLNEVISSFETQPKIGLPLGNLTSQLFVNIYMNELDQFVKHKLKTKYYIRYADDFVLISENKEKLKKQIRLIQDFLNNKLKLNLHPNKVFIKTVSSGVDFLGWINFEGHRVLRTTTKKRMMRKIQETKGKKETVQSYLGLLGWGNGWKLKRKMGID